MAKRWQTYRAGVPSEHGVFELPNDCKEIVVHLDCLPVGEPSARVWLYLEADGEVICSAGWYNSSECALVRLVCNGVMWEASSINAEYPSGNGGFSSTASKLIFGKSPKKLTIHFIDMPLADLNIYWR